MKQLKYIKVYEAFESIKLSKTLGFIDKSSKSNFLKDLKSIADRIDFPYSKYSDKYFEYLPFKKALSLNQNVEDQVCGATSKQAFGSYGIEGEVCTEGRIKRTWGASIRNVVCPKCDGTGTKKKNTFEVKWIKFWFDKDGKYIATTATDGKIRPQGLTVTHTVSDKVANCTDTPQEISQYTVIGNLSRADLLSLQTGAYVKIAISGRSLIGRTWKESISGDIFIIQNSNSGSEPSGREWRKYGRNSWVVTRRGDDFSGTPQLLNPNFLETEVDKKEEEEKVDPYTWNNTLDKRYLTVGNNSDMKQYLSGAHFAIVLDYLELSKSSYNKKSEISNKRAESKDGAISFAEDSDIKKMNLNRYIDEISKNIKIEDNFKNIDKIIFRTLGFSKLGYFVLRGRWFDDFRNIIEYIHRSMKANNDYDKKRYYDAAIAIVKNKSKANIKFSIEVDKSLSDNKTICPELCSKLIEVNDAIYNKFKSFTVENLEDMEMFYHKMMSIRNVWRNSERFELTRDYVYYLVENLTDEAQCKRYFQSSKSSGHLDGILSELDRFKRIIERA